VSALLPGLFALLGAPLFTVLGALALHSFWQAGIDPSAVCIEIYRIAGIPTLSAIPLFAFAGFVLAESGAAQRLVRFAQAVLGWLPGGLAIVATSVCALFTAFTGASGMAIVALGGLLYPALLQARYPERFSLGLLTTSGSLGLLFPPSLPMILYAIVARVPVDQLFRAGILPGMLMVLAVSLYSYRQGSRCAAAGPAAPAREVLGAIRGCLWELLLPVVVISGIYGGLIAVNEAAALSVLYVLVVEMAIHREVGWRRLPGIIRRTMVLVGAIVVLLAAALAYTNYLVDAEVPARLLAAVQAHVHSRLAFLVLLNLFLLAMGSLLDMFSALVVVPLVLPVALAYQIHPVHLGIIFLTNLEIGYSTPPAGLNLLVASLRFERPVLELYRVSLPFLAILLSLLLAITYLPWLSLFTVQP
jgi:tripartite ATP-independent transporter DctM subunit